MPLRPYQQRVINEKRELDLNIELLSIFIGGPVFPAVDEDERKRLLNQLEVMGVYSAILGQRIAAFKVAP